MDIYDWSNRKLPRHRNLRPDESTIGSIERKAAPLVRKEHRLRIVAEILVEIIQIAVCRE